MSEEAYRPHCVRCKNPIAKGHITVVTGAIWEDDQGKIRESQFNLDLDTLEFFHHYPFPPGMEKSCLFEHHLMICRAGVKIAVLKSRIFLESEWHAWRKKYRGDDGEEDSEISQL